MCATLLRLFVLTCILSATVSLSADDWPQWRNADGNGCSGEKGLPVSWSENSGVVWKCKLPEWGNSSPIVWGDAVLVTSHVDDEQLVLVKIDKTTGKIAWTQVVGSGSSQRMPLRGKSDQQRRHQKFHALHNMATPSPVTDGEVVVVHFGNGDLAAYDFAGKQLWRRNLQKDHGPYTIWWGHGNSPVLHENLVMVTAMQDSCADLPGERSESYLAAYDKRTGEPAWKTPRRSEAKAEAGDSYTTPIFRENNGRVEMVVHGGQIIDAYDPATGKRLWSMPGLVGIRPVSGPLAAHGMIYLTQGMRRAMLAIRPNGTGKRTPDDVVWKFDQGTCDCPTPVISGEQVFMVSDNGIARCLDVHSGRSLWKERIKGTYKASPVVAQRRVYFLNTEGLTTVLAASSRLERLAENQIDETTVASPAISGGKIFIRGKKWLYCIGK
ncbi:MAG: PQQ-binding-like beta-propeller repeat protein [Thermoguttaceae bacterium]